MTPPARRTTASIEETDDAWLVEAEVPAVRIPKSEQSRPRRIDLKSGR